VVLSVCPASAEVETGMHSASTANVTRTARQASDSRWPTSWPGPD
jgi:hypothetical protein